ncbi:adenosylhomocysteinase [Thermoclostridium caenicola]|uniref:Adenosylhomocysteinase n=1 Tax=Thermoclostridium caenicola TaxID=659425 RepID=A0A1M6FBV9_9FIRM|nr:adenosylhomocysteinase [Thermoclostridium caenicola]SHI95200.1 adenosylhomocysteinase [Thermoclostridium caenicola]HOL84822.1 adenosylhomocysteinase [Thermoclostridium caenicola]HOP72465.1 adenosylhomocysteinase [Thermoclostridium caenicola]HPO76968.1 adenosylhomocysteinase [Thermoclostridium caenicola]HPU21391.1 adenosylhomocysteinase [Thermoclostridium caenicola]
MKSMIRDISLADSGRRKIEWVKRHMPILSGLEEEFKRTRPFEGVKISLSIHLEAKTAYLSKVLAAGGAQVAVTGSNPLSTQDDVAAGLVADGMEVFAWYNATPEEYREHIRKTLEHGPHIVIDDGGDLVNCLHNELPHLLPNVWGGCEETTTGILRLKAMERDGALKIPMMAVNDAMCKHLFDNRYGTGQSVWDGINRTTNLIVAGKTVVVAGYGWCGKGVAMRAKGLGARVIVTEVDPVKAIEAVMDGFSVMTMDEAAPLGDIFITVTGCNRVIYGDHYKRMKDGAVLCNAGHFNVEICIPELEALAVEVRECRKDITGYRMADGRWIYLLGEGRLVNLACGDGHPAEIMDMSFAVQALASLYIVENRDRLKPGVFDIPESIDQRIAMKKLESMGIRIDTLTADQEQYLGSWNLD